MSENRPDDDPEFKARVVLELISGRKDLRQASREYGIEDKLLLRWKQEFLERAGQVFDKPKNPEQERIAEMQRKVDRLKAELDLVKKVQKYAGSPPKENE